MKTKLVESIKDRKFVTITEAYKIAGVSRRTIYNWLYAGLLTAYRVPSGAIRIDRTQLITKEDNNRNKEVFKTNLGIES